MNEKPETLNAPEEDDFQKTATKEHVRPRNSFRGHGILYCPGSRILYRMACDDTRDLIAYQAAAFVFIHIHPRDEMITGFQNMAGRAQY